MCSAASARPVAACAAITGRPGRVGIVKLSAWLAQVGT